MGAPPRCPFATVESCPRYYQSLSLLGNAGGTSIDSAEDQRLIEKWKTSDLWPKTKEQETSISGNNKFFGNFCPEVSFERFGYFASYLGRYSNELDHDLAHEQLGKIGASSEDYRWAWSSLTTMHFTECTLYSVLLYRQNDTKKESVSKDQTSGKVSPSIETNDKFSAPKVKRKNIWRNLSSKLKFSIISVTTIVALLAGFLTNIEKIGNFFKGQKNPPSIPNIVVKLSNSIEEGVRVSARGDFILWLPGPGARHTMGKYEFLMVNGKSPEGGRFVVPQKESVTVYAKIMNEAYFTKILFQSDCDLSLIVYRAEGGLTNTNQIPFTPKAIKEYYLDADVGK